MPTGNDLAFWLNRVSQQLQLQSVHLNEVEKAVKRLEEEMIEWKMKNYTRIDKVEYNFDQLKVEKLEGTLNIGLTPIGSAAGGSEGSIDELSVAQQSADQQSEDQQSEAQQSADEISNPLNLSPTYSQLFDQMERYLEQEVPKEIQQLENRFQFVAGQEYRKAVIDDIRKQLEPRIHYYLAHPPEGKNLPGGQEIVAQLKKDVHTAIRIHFDQLARRGREQ